MIVVVAMTEVNRFKSIKLCACVYVQVSCKNACVSVCACVFVYVACVCVCESVCVCVCVRTR